MDLTETAQADGAGRHTLLIVDDDEDWTEALKAYFLDKYQVQVANSAGDAIEMVRRHRPSVIIVDLVMPSIDGFGIIHRLNTACPLRIPTILLTGWKTFEVEECAQSVGCAAVLSKPITLPALDSVVSSLVNGGSTTQTA